MKLFSFTLVFFFFFFFSFGQNNELFKSPKSPTVASLESYFENKLNYSTGDLKLEIPIFTLEVDDFKFPIKLYYDYKGYDKNSMPTQLGYGWNMQSTGFINVDIRGLGDFKSNGYVYGKTGLNYVKPLLNGDFDTNKNIQNNIFSAIRDGFIDSEPDRYDVILPNLNSTFYINESGLPYTVPKDQNKISYSTNSDFPNFIVTDGVGNKYTFSESENLINKDCSTYLDLKDVKNSYCLTNVLTRKNNQVNFSYETKSIQFKDINYVENSEYYQNGGCSLDVSTPPTYCYKIDTKYIKQISSSTSVIIFNYEDKDVYTSLLNEIIIKKTNGIIVKRFKFNYNNENQLINIVCLSGDKSIILNEFEYFGNRSKFYPNSPDQSGIGLYSYNVDNPITNSINATQDFTNKLQGSLKKIVYATKGFSEFEYEPNYSTYNLFAKSPSFWNDSSNYSSSLSCSSNQSNQFQTDTKLLNILYPQFIKVVVSANAPGVIGVSEARANASISGRFLYNSTQIKAPFNSSTENIVLNAYAYHEGSYISPSSVGGGTSIIYVQPGSYNLETSSSWSSGTKPNSSITVYYNDIRPLNYYVGGLRLKSITKNNLNNNEYEKIAYNYNDVSGKSTGSIKSSEKSLFRNIKTCYQSSSGGVGVNFEPSVNDFGANYFFAGENFNTPKLNPLPVVYGSVVEEFLNVNNKSNGKIQYNFLKDINASNQIALNNSFYNKILKIKNDNIGVLSEKIVYNSVGSVVEKFKTNYSLIEFNNLQNMFAMALPIYCKENYVKSYWPITQFELYRGIQTTFEPGQLEYTSYYFKPYVIESSNYVKVSETHETFYGGEKIIAEDKFNYNNETLLLNSTESNNSNGVKTETKYFYATDPNMMILPFVNDLIASNTLETPLMTQNFINGEKVLEQLTLYAKDATTQNLLLPKSIYSAKFPNMLPSLLNIGNLEKKVTYDQYDDKGNVLQYTPENGAPISIIWGYNKTQPIAKIENETYAQVQSYESNLQTLSNATDEDALTTALNVLRSNLPDAMVTTYTHIPLVGVSTITDPKGLKTTYEYDAFNRLKYVKDQDGNVLQKYCHNYKGEQIDCVVYGSVAKSGSFTKNNCASGGVGSPVTYTVAAGAYTSAISQTDADAKAQTDVNNNGQAYANTNGICTFSSIVKSGTFSKNNCAAGGVGSPLTYTVAAGSYTSTISQADADAKAQTDVNNNGQTYANTNGICTFSSIVKSGTFSKNNCAAGGVGSPLTYTVAAGSYTSTISQADADAKAQTDVNNNGQTYANTNGICTFSSAVKIGNYTKNNCAAGGVGSLLTYTVAAGSYTSTISQADADAKAQTDVNNNGQTYANTNGICTFSSIVKSGTFSKNNCAAGGVGSLLTYTVAAGAYSSNISQADADLKAQTDVNNNGQTYANTNGICTFSSIVKSGTFSKNNCAAGGVGSSVTYTVAVGAYTSTISQADADAKAQTDVNNNGQTYANTNGICTFSSIVKSGNFTKNNCAAGGVGSPVTYTVAVGAYTSTISQADADAKAQTDVNNNGQTYANTNGICSFSSIVKSGNFTKNNCAAGGVGSPVTYTVAVGAYTSTISQADADAKAQTDVNNNGQTYANTNGICTFSSIVKSGTFSKNNCASGGVGSPVTYTVAAGAYTSTISQADADVKAQTDVNNNGQTYANTNGICTFSSIVKSGTFSKNNCAAGGVGSLVTYTVAAGSFTSTISQADADAKAQTAVNNNGQTYANTNGICTFSSIVKSGTFSKNNCAAGGVGSPLTYTVAAGSYTSTISQADADAKAQTDVNNNGQTYANANGICTFSSIIKSGNFTKNNCAAGGVGSSVFYSVAAGTFTSTSSQSEADNQAQNYFMTQGQANANANGSCTFYSVAKSGVFARNNCAVGYIGSSVTYNVVAGTYSSTISQADADNKAQGDVNANGQNYANINGGCSILYKNILKSSVLKSQLCATNEIAQSITYSVAAGTYTSTISQVDADSKAQTDIAVNGQNYANTYGICKPKSGGQ